MGSGEEGIHELEQILAIDPRFGPALGLLGRECIFRGRADDALTLAERAYASVPQHPNAVGFLAGMLQRAGNRGRSRRLLDSFERENPWAVPRARAEFEFAFADVDAAVEAMAAAVDNRDPGIWLLLLGSFGKPDQGHRAVAAFGRTNAYCQSTDRSTVDRGQFHYLTTGQLIPSRNRRG